MLCNISWNFRAIWLDDIDSATVALTFIIEIEDDETNAAIEDVAFEFEAHQDHGIDLRIHVQNSLRPLEEFVDLGYLVYAPWES